MEDNRRNANENLAQVLFLISHVALQVRAEEGAVLVEGKEVRAKQEPPGGVRSAELVKSRTKSRLKSRTRFTETFKNVAWMEFNQTC